MVDGSPHSGFKTTGIGLLPEEWPISLLSNSCHIITDGSHYSPVECRNGTKLIATVYNMGENRINIDRCKRISDKDYELLVRNGCKPMIGDILFSKDGTVGICFPFKQKEDVVLLSSIAILRPKKILDPTFASQYLRSEIGKKQVIGLKTGTALSRITLEKLRFVKIPIPSMSEQQKIAKTLSDTDALIETLDALISKKKNIKQGLMQTLLTRGIGHTKFKKTEIGKIPEEWEIHEINKICEKPQYGYTQNAISSPLGPKFLRITDVQDGVVFWKDVPYCRCPDNLIEKYALKQGDILFARTGATTGKSYLVEDCPRAIFASYLIRLRPKKTVNSYYLYAFFNSFIYWMQIRRNSIGSAQGGVNANTLSKIVLPVPRFDEQQEIAKILSETDRDIKVLEKKRDKYKLLKTGLMQQLLTGGIRVK